MSLVSVCGLAIGLLMAGLGLWELYVAKRIRREMERRQAANVLERETQARTKFDERIGLVRRKER